MKIYFAGSIRGGREDVKFYQQIINFISGYGEVLTEHVGNENLTQIGESINSDEYIFNRDLEWLISANLIIAEVSTPSLGVGYELGIAESLNKPILCLCKTNNNKRLSAMINGNNKFSCGFYEDFSSIKLIIKDFINKNTN